MNKAENNQKLTTNNNASLMHIWLKSSIYRIYITNLWVFYICLILFLLIKLVKYILNKMPTDLDLPFSA